MKKEEKIETLVKVSNTLKSEFIGLDDIIDQIITSIKPWYVTPEVIERPIVVSLWGMTGTGKSSVVKRLIELLDLSSNSMVFDCGSEVNDGDKDVADKISERIEFGSDERDRAGSTVELGEYVFVFDEFQYARTIDENSCEVDKPNLRPIWTLMDSGVLNVTKSSYEANALSSFHEDLEAFVGEPGNSEIPMSSGKIVSEDDVKRLLEALGYFYFNRGIPGVMKAKGRWGYDDAYDYEEEGNSPECDEDDSEKGKKKGKDEKENPYRPLELLNATYLRFIIRCGSKKRSAMDTIGLINSFKTLGEFVSFLGEEIKYMKSPRTIDAHKSLIFIIGNLDEAFTVGSDLSPDISADIFYHETSKVSISDIKNALRRRFRAEQISRFGNSLIKYPTLKEEHFKRIIAKEVGRILTDFKKVSGINVEVSKEMSDLLYFEGVFPTQGVRPVFTTIGTILTPLLSDILISGKESDKVIITPETTSFKRESIEINLVYPGKTEKKEIKLVLGSLRCPKNRKNRYACAVHESGHAIALSYLTGRLPKSIVAVAADNGGFCSTYDPETARSIKSVLDVKNNIMVSMAGYEAESIMFDHNKVLLGSGSDISEAWEEMCTAAYDTGFFNPYKYVTTNCPGHPDGDAIGIFDNDIQGLIKNTFYELRTETKKILEDNKTLLVQAALVLGEKGEMSDLDFSDLIEKYGNTLTLDRMKEAKNLCSDDYYLKKLLEK